MAEEKRIVNEERKDDNMVIQNTEVKLEKEDENQGIGYELVIGLE